jgi:GNAT superfamily N-acetyltransferase
VGPASIRDATLDDARAIAEVHVASWRWAYPGLMPDELLAELSVDEREKRMLVQLKGPDTTVLVAEMEDTGIVGFASMGPSRDDDAEHLAGELYAIYLLHSATGSGVGRSLLERSIARLRGTGFSRTTAWVLASNQRARSFYEREGWVWDGSRSEHRFDCASLPIVRYRIDLRRVDL